MIALIMYVVTSHASFAYKNSVLAKAEGGQYGELAKIWIFWLEYLSALIRFDNKQAGIL